MSAMCLDMHSSPDANVQGLGPTVSDEKLLVQIAKGEQNALRTLFTRHHARVYRFASRFVKDRGAAEEVVNDTFLIAWQQAQLFEGRSRVATWLLGIARYRALGAVKMRKVPCDSLNEQHEAALVDIGERVDDRMQREDSERYLKRCLASLPRKQAFLVELYYFRNKSLKETAIMTGVPLNTIKTRLFLARKKLAMMLVDEKRESIPGELRGDPRSKMRAVVTAVLASAPCLASKPDLSALPRAEATSLP